MTKNNLLDVQKRRIERDLQAVEPCMRIEWLKLKKKACLELIKDYQAELKVYGTIK